MKPWLRSALKIMAALVALILVFHFWPALVGLVMLVALAFLGFGGAIAVGLTVLLAVTAAVGLGLLAGIVAVGVSLAPLWIPVLAVVGLIALVRGARGPRRA